MVCVCYYTVRSNRIVLRIVLLLAGGDKDTQSRDIARAKEMLCEWGDESW